MTEAMQSGSGVVVTLPFVLTIAGIIIGMCLTIIGYFLKLTHKEMLSLKHDMESFKIKNSEELGKAKGQLELYKTKSTGDLEKFIALTEEKHKTLMIELGKLHSDMSGLKNDMSILKNDLVALKADVLGIKKDFDNEK